MKESVDQRRKALLRIIHHSPMTPICELADRLEVSERTIRQDLKSIRESGVKCKPVVGYAPDSAATEPKTEATIIPKSIADAWVIQITDGHPEVGRQDHGLYWRPNSAGYTRDIADAGIYTEVEAKRAQGKTPNPRDIARPLIDVLLGKLTPGSVGELLSKLIEKSAPRTRHLGKLRQALTEQRKLYFRYSDTGVEDKSDRVVQPRSLVFRGDHWSLLAWCEVREEYRSFRPERMTDIHVMAERYRPSDAPTKRGE